MKETTAFQFRVTVKYSHRLFNNGHTLKLRPAIPVKGLRWKIDVIVCLFLTRRHVRPKKNAKYNSEENICTFFS